MTFRLLLIFFLSTQLARATSPPIEFRDGDRVIFIGNTFIERAQAYGHLETWLTAAFPEREITFRNLGWSGDTVFGHARSYFGPPEEGIERLTQHLEELKPTLIVSAYGAVAAFEGESGIESFVAGYEKLLSVFKNSGARIVLMSPPPAENLPAPLPNQDAHNERLARYSEVIGELANRDGHGFADVFTTLREAWAELPHPLTENGLHFTEAGYAAITPLIAKTLGVDPGPLSVELDAATGKPALQGLTLDAIAAGPEAVTLRVHPDVAVPRPLTFKATGLAGGTYSVKTPRPLAKVSAGELAEGIQLQPGQWNPSLSALRHAILRKNELFFHRWRPQNETYLFGFRKHEQGNNAVEIPQFEPLIQEQESRIQELKKPVPLTLSLRR